VWHILFGQIREKTDYNSLFYNLATHLEGIWGSNKFAILCPCTVVENHCPIHRLRKEGKSSKTCLRCYPSQAGKSTWEKLREIKINIFINKN
jgi:hypothetical protein